MVKKSNLGLQKMFSEKLEGYSSGLVYYFGDLKYGKYIFVAKVREF